MAGKKSRVGRPAMRLRHDPQALRYALEKSGLSQVEFAERLGYTQAYVSYVLAGKRSVAPPDLLVMARILNCPVVVIEAKRDVGEAS